jgi:hypothetical protein
LTVRGLRDVLEAFAQRAVLDAHYQSYPEARPDLAEVALATAQIDGSPLANRPDLVRRAAEEIGAVKDHPPRTMCSYMPPGWPLLWHDPSPNGRVR